MLFSEFSTNMVFVLGLTYLLTSVFNKGIYGAWTGLACYLVFHAVILFIGFMSKKWIYETTETKE